MLEFDLVIVRHAEAVESLHFSSDSERRLTPRGEKQANGIAQVRRLLNVPSPQLVFTSGYVRAEQTLERALQGEVLSVIRDSAFAPDGSVESAWAMLLQELKSRDFTSTPCIWVVGHNPHIERFIQLIDSHVGRSVRPFKKANLAWIALNVWQVDKCEAVLRAYVPALKVS